MKTTMALLMLFVSVFFLSACNGGCLNTKEVRDLLNSKLSIGDAREKVEAVLNDSGIIYSYDKYSNRYQATIRDEQRCGPYQAISVYISFDKTGKLTEIKVFESYTMP